MADLGQLVVKPVDRGVAREMCKWHPHARSLPNTAKFSMAAYIDGRPAGLAVWGWGIRPRSTPTHLFHEEAGTGIANYLELSRFFVFDWCPKFTASKFLSTTHRLLRRYVDGLEWLYTYAAGFQGLVGTIYQATNYTYIGRQACDKAFYLIPGVGLVHQIALWHRYGSPYAGNLRELQKIYPDAKRLVGYNFRYIYFVCPSSRKQQLLRHAKFTEQPYPTKEDLEIYLEDADGNREPVSPERAGKLPVVSRSELE